MPVGDVLVCDTGGHIEHDDTALSLNIIPIPKSTKLLLPGSVPNIEADRAEVGGEGKRVNFDTESGWWRKR